MPGSSMPGAALNDYLKSTCIGRELPLRPFDKLRRAKLSSNCSHPPGMGSRPRLLGGRLRAGTTE